MFLHVYKCVLIWEPIGIYSRDIIEINNKDDTQDKNHP